MKLKVTFPENLVAQSIVQQRLIPCLCRVGTDFEVIFQSPLQESVGILEEWDIKEVDARVPAGAGGKYSHCKFGLISIKKLDAGSYQVLELSMFDESFGWCIVVQDGGYGAPGEFSDPEE